MNQQDPSQIEQLNNYILQGKFIKCDGEVFGCSSYDFEEAFPNKAGEIFFEKGWRYEGGLVLCPDCCTKNKK